ncbi:hypothetical protein ACF09C_10120 [Streptomyces sp. NPDC014870]|uniref:hypothetical protein n=1 Tax=Streptomyces sp. NPDC014870 TaxID=3364925 RepID=UPI0036FE639F
MAEYLGPLELVGDRWIIGDPKREGGTCLVFTREGIEYHRNGAPEPLELVPWERVMSLQVDATSRGWMATRAGGAIPYLAQSSAGSWGRDACSVHALVRHPYDDWFVRYTHHERAYSGAHIYLVSRFIRAVSDAKLLPRLGDPQWVSLAVAKIAPLKIGFSTARRVKDTVEGVEGAGRL